MVWLSLGAFEAVQPGFPHSLHCTSLLALLLSGLLKSNKFTGYPLKQGLFLCLALLSVRLNQPIQTKLSDFRIKECEKIHPGCLFVCMPISTRQQQPVEGMAWSPHLGGQHSGLLQWVFFFSFPSPPFLYHLYFRNCFKTGL